MALNVTQFLEGAQNITKESEFYSYAARELFRDSVIFVFSVTLFIMLLLGMILVRRDKANFYAIFVLSILIMGILLFFTFWFPVIPQMIENLLGGII